MLIGMTILEPSVHQLHKHLWHVKKLVQKYKLASRFGAKSIVKIDYCNAAFTSSTSAKVKLNMHKMVKTYICVIMNLNQKFVQKLLFYSQQPTYFLEFRCKYYFVPGP